MIINFRKIFDRSISRRDEGWENGCEKRESHGLVPRDETRCKVMAYTFLRSYIFKTVVLLGQSQRLGLGVTFYVLSVTFYVLSDRSML